jgi:hypothetical protein
MKPAVAATEEPRNLPLFSSILYAKSSQCKEWTFRDLEELQEKRKERNSISCIRLVEAGRLSKETAVSVPHYLTAEQEMQLISYYESKIPDICRFKRLNRAVQGNWAVLLAGTAVMFHKRLYQSSSLLDSDPKHAMWGLMLTEG